MTGAPESTSVLYFLFLFIPIFKLKQCHKNNLCVGLCSPLEREGCWGKLEVAAGAVCAECSVLISSVHFRETV